MSYAAVQIHPAENPKPLLWGSVWYVVLTFVPALAALVAGRGRLALALAPLPLIFPLLSSPKTCLYLFLISIGFYLPTYIGSFALWPFDIAFMVLALAMAIDFLAHTRVGWLRTSFDVPFLLLIGATWISGLLAYDRSESVIPSVRILLIYLAARVIFLLALRIGVRKLILFYLWQVLLLSLLNLVLFVALGGRKRVYGPAWLAFENYSMTAVPMAVGWLVWSTRFRQRLFAITLIAVTLTAVGASGSRGAALAILLSVPLLLMLWWRHTGRIRATRVRRRLGWTLFLVSILIAGIGILGATQFTGYATRLGEVVDSLTRPQGSIALRVVLWTAAVKAFATSPITGIGIGNFNLVDQVVPEMRAEPVWFYVKGMSAHNVVLHYLAETGILGVVALLSLTVAGLLMALRAFRRLDTTDDMQTGAAVVAAMVVFALSIFFMRAWTWSQEGYQMAILFGLTAAWHHQVTARPPR